MTAITPLPLPADENKLITERREKLAVIRQQGIAFPNDFKPKHRAAELLRQHGDQTNEELEPLAISVVVAGRLMLKRVMGKASFGTLQDATGQIQLFVTRDALGEEPYATFKHWDLGDILGAEGTLFKTKTGDLSGSGRRLFVNRRSAVTRIDNSPVLVLNSVPSAPRMSPRSQCLNVA